MTNEEIAKKVSDDIDVLTQMDIEDRPEGEYPPLPAKMGFALTTNPVAAAFEAMAALFNFLSTPQGQLIVEDIRKFDIAFYNKIKGLIDKIHNKVTMQVTILSSEGGDWTALYIDGKKAIENHSLSEREVVEALGIDCECRELSDEYLEESGSNFPDTLEELSEDCFL